YLGLLLYDADRVGEAAATPDEKDLLDAQRGVFLDPADPEVIAAARESGIPEDWLDAARRSPVYALVSKYKVALPLHPEYRTLPMVWYVPPLSPVLDAVTSAGGNQDDPDHVFAAVTRLRIPLEYLAELFTAGDTDVVAGVLMKLTALRSYMRQKTLGEAAEETTVKAVGLTAREAEDLHRLLAVAKYKDRYVVPAAHKEDAAALTAMENRCPVETSGGPAERKVMLGIPTLRRRNTEAPAGGHL
ncbi:MAG TPA: nitrate reductase subunit beta, partial [Armatimonadota bacterium]|nr:nitrate reductase subunit beta [Armatimonadota bacterium]